jgi:hypothetical protein
MRPLHVASLKDVQERNLVGQHFKENIIKYPFAVSLVLWRFLL